MFTSITTKLLAALMLAAQLSGACATTAPGASANVYTLDGNHWSYDMLDYVDGIPAYDGMPVTVWLSDNGTPDDVTDDVVLGLVSPSLST